MANKEKYLYSEKTSSEKTEMLFIALTIVFFSLFIWRTNMFMNWNTLAVIFLCLSCFFLIYSVNYRSLIILITPEFLQLRFSIFKWTVSVDNIEKVRLDEVPDFKKYGGAGIHFMFVRKRYEFPLTFWNIREYVFH